ncbi:MAG: polyprenol monophosphomannose synthase [Aeromicrobium erythreum]
MKSIVIVPTYQERETVATLLDALARTAPEVDVLVVDDASPDGTASVVRSHPRYGDRVHLLERAGKEGLGAAYRAGFRWALQRGYEGIVQMDADLSHPPERVPALLAALDDADVAVGSRYVEGGGSRGWPWRRRLLSRGGNLYVRLVLGLHVHDCTAGFKAFRADALRTVGALRSQAEGYCFQVENTWRAERAGLRVRELPIVFTERTAGASKMTAEIAREALRLPLAWRRDELVAALRHHRPVEIEAA